MDRPNRLLRISLMELILITALLGSMLGNILLARQTGSIESKNSELRSKHDYLRQEVDMYSSLPGGARRN